ncbi:MAG: MarR family transcriptional regulator [Candidatus Omnitrophota bacterium]|nr:MarR family transcriptional regulator [Candidatus Omnitrophota bacterium]
MTDINLAEFADKVTENMAAIWRDFLKQQTGQFYKVKVTLPQLAIMELIHKSGELNMSDMARSMNVTTAAMTGIVDRLVREGYVARISVPNDRRVIMVKLTAKGDKTIKNVIEHKRQMVIKIFAVLSNTEREDYLKILTRIREGLSA